MGEGRDRWNEDRLAPFPPGFRLPLANRCQARAAEHRDAVAQRRQPGQRFLTERDRVREVDGYEVGQKRHREVGQFLPGPHDVQGAADTCADLVEDCQALARPLSVGDVHAHGVHAQSVAVGVLQAEDGGRVRVRPAPERRRPSLEHVERWSAAVQHLAQHFLGRFGLGAGRCLRQPAVQPLFARDAVMQLHGVVHPGAAQLQVADTDPDRGADERFQHRSIRCPRGDRGRVGRRDQPMVSSVLTGQRGYLQAQIERAAVAVADRRKTGPATPGTAPLRERRCLRRIPGGTQHVRGRSADGLRGRVAGQSLSGLRPADDHPFRIDHRYGRAGHPHGPLHCLGHHDLSSVHRGQSSCEFSYRTAGIVPTALAMTSHRSASSVRLEITITKIHDLQICVVLC